MPAHPIATLTSPSRHGRPNVSVITTATRTPSAADSPARSASALRSGSSGRSVRNPSATFEASTPALAQIEPVARLRDHEVVTAGNHAHRFGGDRGCAILAGHDPALGLRHDLLGDHDDVAVGGARLAKRRGEQRDEVVAGPDLREPLDR